MDTEAPAQEVAERPTWPRDTDVAPVREDIEPDLIKLDRSYRAMYELHRACHKGLGEELARVRAVYPGRPKLLEFACGTGWDIGKFAAAGYDYYGCDLSETALQVAMRRYPRAKFVNCGIEDASILADGSFEVVFCSSLLEHLEDHAAPLRDMIRIARDHLFVMFYEGLAEEGEAKVEHYPFTNPDYLIFGEKFADLQRRYDGYFMKRYAQSTIEGVARDAGVREINILDRSNRPYIAGETVVHIVK
jgi:ubiquinone/menaquinone biosynthesis C-methylase UbiE